MARSRRTLRMRLTLLYGGLFLASSLAVLGFVDALLLGTRSVTRVAAVPPPPVAPSGALPPGAGPGGLAHSIVHLLVFLSVIAIPVLVVASFALAWLVAGRVLQPLRTIMATAKDISARNLHQRLALAGPHDEFRALGETLDELFGRLEASFERQRHFVANASHELRTPLTAERALLQVALADPGASAGSLRSTCEELLTLSRHQERLIEALLTLAGSEEEVVLWEPFDLAAVADRILAGRHDEAERRGIEIAARWTAAPALGDPSLVESLVANLVDNAVRHNRPGGHVEIETTASQGRATLVVRNTGPMIPTGEVARLFEPFQRLGQERMRHDDGHGLGLAIVCAIAKAHGAAVTARPRPEGGLDIEVSFPAVPTGTTSSGRLDQAAADDEVGAGHL